MDVREFLLFFMTENCVKIVYEEGHYLEVECLKSIISRCLGYGIIVGASVVKLPQVVKLFSERSSEGVSFISVLLDLVATTAGASYGFAMDYPFSAYGEGVFLILQTSLICFLVLYYQQRVEASYGFVALLGLALAYLFSPLVSIQLLTGLQTGNILIVGLSRLFQIVDNLRNSSTGQLSLITVLLLFLGSLARVFTSIQETGDPLVIWTYVVACAGSATILAQIIYYWNSPVRSAKKLR